MSQKLLLLMTMVLGSSMAMVDRATNAKLKVHRSILSRLPEMGYDPDKLNRTAQPSVDSDGRSPE